MRRKLASFRAAVAQHSFRGVLRSLVFYRLFNVTVVNREGLPRKGPAIVIGNHQSYIDGFLLWGAQRTVSFMLFMVEMLKWPVIGNLMRTMGHIPVDRLGGGAGSQALADSEQVLKRGHVLTMFPAGNITKPEFKIGVALLARKTGAPIYPVGISGAHNVWPKHAKYPWHFHPRYPVRVKVGEPLYPEEFISAESLRQAAQHAVDSLRR